MTVTAPVGLRARYAGRERRHGFWTLCLVVCAGVALAAVARTDPGRRFLAEWLAAALPAAGFAVAGAALGQLGRSRPLLARAPNSVRHLGAVLRDEEPGERSEAAAGAAAAPVVAPFVLAAAVVAFRGDDMPILVCAFLLVALVAAAAVAWTLLGAAERGLRPPVCEVRLAGVATGCEHDLDLLAAVSLALRAAVLGTAVAAAAAALPGDGTVEWVFTHPAVAAVAAVALALVAAPGAEAGCIAAGALAGFGPGAVVGFAACSAVCDVRVLRMLQRLVAPGTAWRTACAALPVCVAGAVWTGVLLA